MSSPYRDQPRSEPLAGYEQPREVCRHIAIDAWRCPDCGESVRASVADLRDRLATAEDERDEAREEKRTWVEASGKELDAQRREIERLLTERDESLEKLALAMEGLECAELHARSALKSWDDGNEPTVTHVRDVENAANVCAGVLARIRSMT